MGVGLYISLEKPVEGVDATTVSGKALARYFEELNEQSVALGARPLGEFVSLNLPDTLDFLDGEGIEVKPDALQEQWFSSEEGLIATRVLIEFYKSKAEGKKSLLLVDLESAEEVLRKASAAKSRFHFTFDLP